tara:strand:+ start:200 stop:571 length:372 start_codon:yes stop_codon:yes gene_type:complete
MTTLNKAKAHFREIANKGTGHITVPEWDTTVYWKIGGLNFASQNKIMELTQQGKSAEALVEMLILRSLDENNKKMFKLMDKQEIMREVDPNVILKIVSAMGADDDDDYNEIEETSKAEKAIKN